MLKEPSKSGTSFVTFDADPSKLNRKPLVDLKMKIKVNVLSAFIFEVLKLNIYFKREKYTKREFGLVLTLYTFFFIAYL